MDWASMHALIVGGLKQASREFVAACDLEPGDVIPLQFVVDVIERVEKQFLVVDIQPATIDATEQRPTTERRPDRGLHGRSIVAALG